MCFIGISVETSLNDLNFDPSVLCHSLSRSISKEKAIEPRTNRICSTHQLLFAQRVQPLCCALPGQQERAFILLLGPITDNGLCPTNPSREPSRHRSLSTGAKQQALPQRPRPSRQSIHVGRCQREPRLENLCRFRTEPYSDRSATLRGRGTGNRSRCEVVCIRLHDNRSLPFSVPVGSIQKSQSCNQAAHVDGNSKLNPSIYRDNQWPCARCQSIGCDHSRTRLIHRDGPWLCGLRTLVPNPTWPRFLCNPFQRQSSIQTSQLTFTRPRERSEKRSNYFVDRSKELVVLSGGASPRQLSRAGYRSKIRLPDQQFLCLGAIDRCSLQVSLADRAIFQMDQTTPQNQDVLRRLAQQCKGPGLDRDLHLRPYSDHQEGARTQARHLHNSTSLEPNPFRENAHSTPV